MTQRFKRKTLAVSIAAALFGGMALAVAPIMTPIAWANQFEASGIGTVTFRNIYTGVSATSTAVLDESETGTANIQASGYPGWSEITSDGLQNGKVFTVTFPAGIELLTRNGFVTPFKTSDPTDIALLNPAIGIFVTPIGADLAAQLEAVDVNSSGQWVMTFVIYRRQKGNNVRPTSFTLGMNVRMTTPKEELRIDFADPLDSSGYPVPNALGLGSSSDLKNIHIATFIDTSAVVTAAAATSVNPTLANQAVANIDTEFLTSTPAPDSQASPPILPRRILFTLDYGKWMGTPQANLAAQGTLTILNDTQLEFVTSGAIAPHNKLELSGLTINAAGLPADTDINVTVTSQASGTHNAIEGFGIHEVKVARTKGTAGKDVTVGLTTDPTTDVLYVGRHEQTVTNVVKLAEAMPGTLTPNGTLNYTLSTGVFNPTSTLTFGGTSPLPTCAAIGATASAKFECAAGTSVTGTAGAWTLPPRQAGTYSGPFNMYNATVGDLNVTIDGTAWSNWTSNVVKLADVMKATTSTLDGSVDTLRLGSSGTTKMTLPDIVIQENNAGALLPGPFVVAIDDGLNLIVLPTTEVKVFDKDGTEVNVQLPIVSPSWLIGGGGSRPTAGDPRGIDIEWTSLPAANGPYKIVISGLQVEADSSSTSPGDYNLSVASTLLDGDIRPIDYRSDTLGSVLQVTSLAGVYFETFPAVKVIDNLTTTAWVDASGPIDDLSAYSSILPGIAARDKLGSYYLMLQMPPQFTGDWSLWTLGAAGWTMVEPAPTMEELCRTMTSYRNGALVDVINMPLVVNTDMTVFKDVSVWTGFGVGAPLPDPMVPCLNMFENSTYWYVYTVQ